MSLYNIINGENVAVYIILPMLGRLKKDYPRFRDCYIDKDRICVYTRVGSANQHDGFGEEELYIDPNFLEFKDDPYDNTYGEYYFKVPDEYKADYELMKAGRMKDVAKEYKEKVYSHYPELKEQLQKLFEESVAEC